MRSFNENVKFENRRYQVTWPWKSGCEDLPDNYRVAVIRLRSLLWRFQVDKKLLQNYEDIIQQQLSQNTIEKVNSTTPVFEKKYYMPHLPVLTPGKTTTKVRIVFDASSSIRNGVSSLNDCLYRGPIILLDLCGLVLRFRLCPIIVLADIEKAFLQVGLQEKERDTTRFLWLKDTAKLDIENNLVFRYCCVPFGLVCSPFLLGAIIKYHLQHEGSLLALHIMGNIYVDNVMIGLDNSDEIVCVYEETKRIFRKASMNVHEWNSNCAEFLESIPAGETVTRRVSAKVLGIMWNRSDDTITISGFDGMTCAVDVTKRDVLHSVARILIL